MSEHCPQDGGFIGDAGCTHPNHKHSELVKRIMSGEPKMISAADATAALTEGFYVKNPEGKQVGFGKKLLVHLDTQDPADVCRQHSDQPCQGGERPQGVRRQDALLKGI